MLNSDRLRALRLENRYTHEGLAERLDVGIRMIARYESGQTDPTGDILARMADVFNVSTDYLLGRTDDPAPCIQSGKLNPTEAKVIAALRRGEPLEAIRV